MRLNSLEKLYMCMVNKSPHINIDDDLRIRAKKPLDKMLQMSTKIQP
jgi:quinolinate synthase